MNTAEHTPTEVAVMSLERELETFRRELPNLLRDPANHDKFALIHGDTLHGVWPTVDDALTAGYDKFQLEPFLVKEVTEHERPRHFSRNVTRCP
jgi:hypothetical protein